MILTEMISSESLSSSSGDGYESAIIIHDLIKVDSRSMITVDSRSCTKIPAA